MTGAATFVPIAVSGAIAVLVKNPKVARRPFLRDCIFLFIAASCVFYITSDRRVTTAEAFAMVLIYVFYVGSVLLGEIYKKLRQKKRREARKRRKTSTAPPPPTITDKLMPVLGAFSNDSMRDLFTHTKDNNTGVQSIQALQETQVFSPPSSDISGPINSSQISVPFLSRASSTASVASVTTEIPYIQDLYHQLEEEEKSRRKH